MYEEIVCSFSSSPFSSPSLYVSRRWSQIEKGKRGSEEGGEEGEKRKNERVQGDAQERKKEEPGVSRKKSFKIQETTWGSLIVCSRGTHFDFLN